MPRLAAADELHDFDFVGLNDPMLGVVGAYDDLAIDFDGDAALCQAQFGHQAGNGETVAQDLLLAVQGDVHGQDDRGGRLPLQPGTPLVSATHSPLRMILQRMGRPTYAAIDAAALRHNLAMLRTRLASGVKVLAVVKANGYGHGATLVAPVLDAAGAGWFGVATLHEGIELRQAGIRKPILVLTGAQRCDVPALLEYDLRVSVLHAEMARDLADADFKRPLPIHLKIDTGMARVGVLLHELPAVLHALRRSPQLEFDGLFSHFANSDRVDREFSDHQLGLFKEALSLVRAAGFEPPHIHLANSAASWSRPETHFNMVRPGVILYGVAPAVSPAPNGLRPVIRLTSQILQVKDLPAGAPVSYGQTFVTRRPSRVAVLAIGYADGYDRGLSNCGAVLIHGRRAPVVGAICMDLSMVDVTDIPEVRVGDEAVLWGVQDGAQIRIEEVAAWQKSVSYEVLTRLGPRVPRVLRGSVTG